MNEKLCISICILFLVLITGCSDKKPILLLGNTKSDNDLLEIYQFEDGTKLYSEYVEINYRKSKKEIISLKDALKNKAITIDKITDKLSFVSSADDGGSMIYQYKNKNNDFANKDFVLIKCNTLDGNRNIIISSSDDTLDYCVK